MGSPISTGSLVRAPSRAAAVALLFAVMPLAGCGHPASREECEELFAKNAEIELRETQHVTDPKVISERTAAARAADGDGFTGRCLGKRITSRTLACVRKAASAEQLDRCL